MSQQQQPNYAAATNPPGNPPHNGQAAPRRSNTEQFLPTGEDRAEQLETLQSYEMRAEAKQTPDDINCATLQREFPGIDGSLIAAIYGDSKDMSTVREMLQALAKDG